MMDEYQLRPDRSNECVREDRYFDFLVKLRDSGETNMYALYRICKLSFLSYNGTLNVRKQSWLPGFKAFRRIMNQNRSGTNENLA